MEQTDQVPIVPFPLTTRLEVPLPASSLAVGSFVLAGIGGGVELGFMLDLQKKSTFHDRPREEEDLLN